MPGTSAHPDSHFEDSGAAEEAVRAVLESRAFARAEKLQRFLKYVCEMTFRGDAALVHEHLIAVEVFGRGDDYSPGEDSVVRRQAHALRRKLKEYYETEGQYNAVQIELPVGSYVPIFRARQTAAPIPAGTTPAPQTHAPKLQRTAVLICASLAVLAAAFWAGWAVRSWRQSSVSSQSALPVPLRELWGAWLAPNSGAVLCFSNPATASVRQFAGPLQQNPEHQGVPVTATQDAALRAFFRFSPGGAIYLYPVMAQAKMGEALAAVSLSVFFTRAGIPVQTMQSRFMTWDDLRKSNVILLGHADSNPWVEQVLKTAPFTLAPTDPSRRARILNRSPKQGEQAEYFPALPEQSKSYALLSSLRGVDGSHETLVVGGLDTSSTTAAADFLLSGNSAGDLLKQLKSLAPQHQGPWHFQAVLETDVRDTVALKAWVVALRVL